MISIIKIKKAFFFIFIFFPCFYSWSQEKNKTDENGQKQGLWTFYKNNKEDGLKKEEGYFVNNRKEGEWVFYYDDGKTVRIKAFFKNNRPFGKYEKYYPNGILKEKGAIQNNININSISTYHSNGNIEYSANLNKNGKEQGEVKYFYPNGKIEFNYNAINGSPAGTATIYFEDGSIKKKMEYTSATEVVTIEENKLPEKTIEPSDVVKNKNKAPKIGKPNTRGAKFLPDGFNRCYTSQDEIWQDGYFKNGRLWEGKVFVYDKEGILTKVKIYKEGKFLADGQL